MLKRPKIQSGYAWLSKLAAIAFTLLPTLSFSALAAPLVLSDVGAPTTAGAGVNIRAIWEDAGTVGGTGIDIVGVVTSATLTHTWVTNGARPSIESAGQDQIFIEWRIYQANTYDVATDLGGVLVPAEVLVQFNDVDGPANEQVYTEVCSGAVEFVRIDKNATTGKAFGTIAGRVDTFSVIGDQTIVRNLFQVLRFRTGQRRPLTLAVRPTIITLSGWTIRHIRHSTRWTFSVQIFLHPWPAMTGKRGHMATLPIST